MKVNVNFSIDEDVINKFKMAASLSNVHYEDALEKCMCNYIAQQFNTVSKQFNTSKTPSRKKASDNEEWYGKAIDRIPMWAHKPGQYNYKIIRAFLQEEMERGYVTKDALQRRCSDASKTDVYVPTFTNNFNQMKIDGPKSHGKVFEDDGYKVTIWEEVEQVLRLHANMFLA